MLMSCESNSNKLSKLVGQLHTGISQLAGKSAFYRGVAVGAAGTGMSLLIIAKIRRPRPSASQPLLIKVGPEGKQVMQTTTGRAQPTPLKSPRPGSRSNPLVLEMTASTGPGSRDNPRKLAMGGAGAPNRPRKLNMERVTGQPLPVLSAKPLETKLEKAATQVLTGRGQRFTAENSYRVVQPDRTDTGLAVTPFMVEDEQGQPVEDTSAWCVTHSPTGALLSGPYSTVAKAHHLATQLSFLRWISAPIPEADVARAKQIIGEYQQSLAEK